ncbi:unnamed protein product [Prorocentrum cordatum]|uniref:Uncharacterized protein n=1 Tax=Prorocentrum cordatum TaxID=2364126 RepID=A0ABN9RSW9_9DINO|nr:unnamed protein product [Polarella glacialis]
MAARRAAAAGTGCSRSGPAKKRHEPTARRGRPAPRASAAPSGARTGHPCPGPAKRQTPPGQRGRSAPRAVTKRKGISVIAKYVRAGTSRQLSKGTPGSLALDKQVPKSGLAPATSTTEALETLLAPPGAPAPPAPPPQAQGGGPAPPPVTRGRKRAFSKEMTPKAVRAALKRPEAAELPESTRRRYEALVRGAGSKVKRAQWSVLRAYFGTQSKTDGRQAVVAALLAALVLAVSARERVRGTTAGELSGLPAPVARVLVARAQGG